MDIHELNPDTLRLIVQTQDPRSLAMACNALRVVLEKTAPNIGELFGACGDMLIRQQLIIEQANLLPRVKLEPGGSMH